MPLFVSFEGIDGSGKSTQACLLAQALRAEGERSSTRRPAVRRQAKRSAPSSSAVRISHPGPRLRSSRPPAQLVQEIIAPALARGAHVVCDRFLDSSLAYQGIARDLGLDAVLELNRLATGGTVPDRTILLLLDPAEALRRRPGGAGPDRA